VPAAVVVFDVPEAGSVCHYMIMVGLKLLMGRLTQSYRVSPSLSGSIGSPPPHPIVSWRVNPITHRHPYGGSNGDGTGGGDECAGGAVHLARRSPAEGGDSEIGGDGDGVVMARSLSTSASGGKDMEV
ncbi:hypothetical protein Tco_0517090, partial [Tanacetum coccineum]